MAGLPGGLQGETSLVDYVTVPKEALDDCYSGKNTAAATSGIMMRWATTFVLGTCDFPLTSNRRDIFNVAIDTAVFVSKDGQYSISAFVKDPKAQGRLYRIPVETFKHYTNKIKERYLVSSGRQSDWREIQNALTWEQRRHIDQKLTDWIGRRGIGYRLIGTSPVELGEGINELTLEDGFGSKQTTSTSNVDALLAPGAMWRFRSVGASFSSNKD